MVANYLLWMTMFLDSREWLDRHSRFFRLDNVHGTASGAGDDATGNHVEFVENVALLRDLPEYEVLSLHLDQAVRMHVGNEFLGERLPIFWILGDVASGQCLPAGTGCNVGDVAAVL